MLARFAGLPIGRKLLAGAAFLALASTALIGFAHTPSGRPLLALLPGIGGEVCPVALNADPAQVEKFRVEHLRKRRGERAAGGVPALDFELGKTTRAEVDAWIAKRGAACESERQGSVLRCLGVRRAMAADPQKPSIDDLFLQFDSEGRLVAVDAQHRGFKAVSAIAHLDALAAGLDRVVGPPTKSSGKRDAAFLDGQQFARFELEYGYSNYLAQLSAMNFGHGEVRVRAQYQWLPPGQ